MTKHLPITDQELDIVFRDGVAAHEAHKKRASNPFTLEAFRLQWEKGWIHSQVTKRKAKKAAYQKKYRARKKLEKLAKEEQ